MRTRLFVPTLTALLAAASAALAQNADTAPSNDSILVTATRLPQSADTVAAGVDVIDAATIQQRGDETLVDALSAMAGVHIVQSGGPGGNASLFIRGTDSDQVQVMIDGVPVNDPSDPGGAYNFGVETLSDVARIEVVRGPMSAVYGSGAIGGVVNIITDQGTGNGPHADLTLAGGYPASVLGQGSLHGRSGAFDYNLALEAQSQQGFSEIPRRETTVYTGQPDGFRTELASADLGYTPIDGTRVFVDLRGRSSAFGYPYLGYPAFAAPGEMGYDNDFFVRGGVDSSLFGGVWQTGVVLSYDQQFRHYVNPLNPADPNQAEENSRYMGERLNAQWNNTIRLPDTAFTTADALTAGFDHSTDTAIERLNSASAGYPYIASVRATDQRESGYLGLQSTVLSRLVLSGNVREQAVSGVGDAFTWRVGGAYAIPALYSHLKASYGTAFLAPSLYDRYGIDDFGYVGNPNLKPETSRGYEIGWVTRLADHAMIEATYFHTNVINLIETQFAPVYTSVNIATARMEGVETTLHLQPAPWLDADATYTYTDARNTGTGQLLLRRPYDDATLSLALRPVPLLSIVPQLFVYSSDLDALVNNQGYPIGQGRNPGGAIVNLSASYQFTPQLRLFVWAKNLNNSMYEAANGYAQPGTSFMAGVHLAY